MERNPPWPPRPALFLDFDGTLLEIAEEPGLVAASPQLRGLLPELAPACEGAVAVISGRPITEIDRLLAPHRFAAAGVHGLERRDCAGHLRTPPADSAALAKLREMLAPFVASHPGLLLEDKGQAIALHYRRRPDLAREVEQAIAAVAATLPPELEVLPGSMVLEIKPRAASKGLAVRAFMQEPPFRGRTPLFIGDDVTDEAGFDAVNDLGGVSVKVGDGETRARFRLAGVGAVLGWLERCVAG